MLHGEQSAILLTFIKLPFVINTFVLSIFEWSLKTGVTVNKLPMLAVKSQMSLEISPEPSLLAHTKNGYR